MKTNQSKLEATRRYRKTPKGVLTNIYHKMKERNLALFSLDDFHNKYLPNRKFDRLMSEWKKSGFKKEKKPSFDRINCFKPYTLDNIQVKTWKENRYKQRMELKRIRARKVYQIKDGEIVNTFKSQKQAVENTGLNQSGISMCLNGHRNTCGGYEWSYENPELLEAEGVEE